jgi:CrcB protein
MKELLVVGCGGFAGAVLRYLVSGWVQTFIKSPFPYGTLAVNGIGSFVIGGLAGLTLTGAVSPEVRLFVGIGLLGAFTTFSTFSYETMMLIKSSSYLEAFLNIGINVIIGLVLVYLGYIAGQAI